MCTLRFRCWVQNTSEGTVYGEDSEDSEDGEEIGGVRFKSEAFPSDGEIDKVGTVVSEASHVFLPFKEALAAIHSLNLEGHAEWREWAKSDARSVHLICYSNLKSSLPRTL